MRKKDPTLAPAARESFRTELEKKGFIPVGYSPGPGSIDDGRDLSREKRDPVMRAYLASGHCQVTRGGCSNHFNCGFELKEYTTKAVLFRCCSKDGDKVSWDQIYNFLETRHLRSRGKEVNDSLPLLNGKFGTMDQHSISELVSFVAQSKSDKFLTLKGLSGIEDEDFLRSEIDSEGYGPLFLKFRKDPSEGKRRGVRVLETKKEMEATGYPDLVASLSEIYDFKDLPRMTRILQKYGEISNDNRYPLAVQNYFAEQLRVLSVLRNKFDF
jgi:hypothetical protein